MLWPRSNIERQIMILVIVVVAVIQATAETYNVLDRTKALHKGLVAHAELTANITARSIATPLWDFDMVQVENAFTALRTDPDFVSVTLVDNDGSLQANLTAEIAHEAPDTLSHTAPVIFWDTTPPERLGSIEIVFSTERNHAAIQDMILQNALRSVLVLMAILGALFVVARRVTRPLAQIRDSIICIHKGDLSCSLNRIERKDQIGEIADAIELFRLNAIEMEELRKSNDRAAREERRRIRAALESTQDAALILRETGEVAFQNTAARAMLGPITKRQPSTAMVVDADDRRRISDAIVRQEGLELETYVTAGTTSWEQEDGTPVRMRINPIYDADNVYLGIVILATDITEQVQNAQRIRHLAEHDSLTGLKNRRLLEEEIDRLRNRSAGTEIALILLDLDRFKLINDTLGHPIGDELLIKVAELLKLVATERGLPARLGGDEFAILMQGPGALIRARKVAAQIVDTLSRPMQVDGRQLRTGASIGIARLDTQTDTSLDAMRKADLALYEAKKRGRGQFFEFEDTLEQEVSRKSLIERELRTALANHDIFAVYQRQIDLKTNRLSGYEALARWSHPTLGTIGADEFIGVAEETNQIGALTEQMLRASCAAAKVWRDRGFEGRVSVNISPHLFGPSLLELLDDALLATACPADALEVEITEAVLLSDSAANLDIVNALRAKGMRVALDDFGMGYSSLSYLQTFPVDRIKIDRAFVSKLGTSKETDAIVHAIVELGHALGMRVTGEGAESQLQIDGLRKVGADCVQGYYHGTPVTYAETLNDLEADFGVGTAQSA